MKFAQGLDSKDLDSLCIVALERKTLLEEKVFDGRVGLTQDARPMLPALLTALFFAASGLCGQKAAVKFGSLRGNTLRLALAAVILAGLTWFLSPVDFTTRTAKRFLWSGLVGFGVGDVALFLAYPRLGSRLTVLTSLCSAPLYGALGDWLLLGFSPSGKQWICSAIILTGVGLALAGKGGTPQAKIGSSIPGLIAALVSGCGQGFGASLSRFAQRAAVEEHVRLIGINEAFIRSLPGLAFSWGVWIVVSAAQKAGTRTGEKHIPLYRSTAQSWMWLLSAATFGPIIGVSCFQWALRVSPSSLVLSITATTPLLIMPFAIWLENDRPSLASVAGGLLAVAGVIALILTRF